MIRTIRPRLVRSSSPRRWRAAASPFTWSLAARRTTSRAGPRVARRWRSRAISASGPPPSPTKTKTRTDSGGKRPSLGEEARHRAPPARRQRRRRSLGRGWVPPRGRGSPAAPGASSPGGRTARSCSRRCWFRMRVLRVLRFLLRRNEPIPRMRLHRRNTQPVPIHHPRRRDEAPVHRPRAFPSRRSRPPRARRRRDETVFYTRRKKIGSRFPARTRAR